MLNAIAAMIIKKKIRLVYEAESAFLNLKYFACRDSLGGSVVVGDKRWAGAYGVQADFVAMSHCSVEIIRTEDIMVCCPFSEVKITRKAEQAWYFHPLAGDIGEV